MEIMDDAKDFLTKTEKPVDGSQKDACVTSLDFMKGFARLCNDGWEQGWHERNGGNLTYRMKPEEVEAARPYFHENPSPWVPMDVQADNLANEFFVSTGTGRYMRNIIDAPELHTGIVELNEHGNAYRIVWGLNDGGSPTSEFSSHILNHSVRVDVTGGQCRVIYHAHPNNIIAMTFVLPLDARTFTRVLWKAMTECIIVFPMGVGVVPWMVPGGADIAKVTSQLFKKYDAAVWSQHGLFVSGSDFDSTFGLMHCIEKAADIYLRARIMNGGSDDFLNTISDEGLRAIAKEFHITVNEEFLDDNSLI